ncbi:hypothetical protein C1646_664116 [Rhizophagus diaphanus]|nr:hypothetical protein C1646_664116 [Rhizophagus diaphanus] [Rhizophagus sp. MUCL 43196]
MSGPSSNCSFDFDGSSARAKFDTSLLNLRDENVNFKLFSTSAETKAGLTGLGMKAGVNLAEVETSDGIKARVGLNFDSGTSISSDGVEAKVGGLGVKVGKVTGVSTPFGEVEINFEKFLGL